MISKYTHIKKILLDGPESEIQSAPIDLSAFVAGESSIRFEDFSTNHLEDLKDIIGEADYNSIVETGDFGGDEGFLNLPKGSENLRAYFFKRAHSIFVFAYGEFQPTRYKLYLEGIWTVD